ncbi:MAG: glutathione S-transferase, partial [Pantoea sp.]|nr:glutathione S-transferase [Pantoea sp.]
MLTILGRTSSINVRKVVWLCDELDLDYLREEWGDGFQSTHSPEFMALNPNAMVPVLKDDDLVIWESNAILRYLANAYGGEWLYPIHPQSRAPIDQWMDWQSTELNTSWRYAFMS